MRSAELNADAAYYASRAATWTRCEAIYPEFGRLMEDPIRDAEHRINTMSADSANHVLALPLDDDDAVRQQSISQKVHEHVQTNLLRAMAPFDRARMIAFSAPMCGRWLDSAPSKTLDRHMSVAELTCVCKMHLGADLMEGGNTCRFCGAAMDTKGVHPCSCMSGGDVTTRHNAVRNTIFRYSGRGLLHPELEKMGILDEPGVLVDLRRPADVLIDGVGNGVAAAGRGTERIALDVKVINALGQGHITDTLDGPLQAAAKYRDWACDHLRTRPRCAERGVRYEPVVFTVQGGCEAHAEALLSQIADAVGRAEGQHPAIIKKEMLEAISMSIMRSAAKAVLRRRRPMSTQSPGLSWLQETMELEEEPID